MADFKKGEVEYTIKGEGIVMADKGSSSQYARGHLIPKMVEFNNIQYKVEKIGVLSHCDKVIIPSSVISIGKLEHCNNMSIPSSVISIGELSYCSDIVIPSSVLKLKKISRCSNIKIDFSNKITGLGEISGLTCVTLPETITFIGDMSCCTNVTIPSSVSSLGTLKDCKDIIIPSSVKSIGELLGCENIVIPSSVSSLGNLEECKDIIVPSSVKSIGDLLRCENIVIPSSVTSLGHLRGCKNITIPSSIKSLSILRNCQITIPSSVSTITEINGETGTVILRMQNITPPIVGKVVNLSKDDYLIVPKGALNVYKNHALWGKFKNISEDPSLGGLVAYPIQSDNIKETNYVIDKEKCIGCGKCAKNCTVRAISCTDYIAKGHKLPSLVIDFAKCNGCGVCVIACKFGAISKADSEPRPTTKKPSSEEMSLLNNLIDMALEDFVVTEEERATLLKKADSIGLSRDEFKLILDSRIQRRMKEKPEEKIEEKKKGFFARLFGK